MDASVSSKATANTFQADVREIVTAKYVRTAGESDAGAAAQPSLVVEPGNEPELAKVLKLANAAALAVIPRSGCRKPNVAGCDLPKLITGAFGTMGVITRAIFRVHPLPKETRTISCATADVREAQRLMLAIQNSKLAHSALQICCEAETKPRVDVLFEGTEAGLAEQVEQVKSIMGAALISDVGGDGWSARQEICSAGEGNTESAGGKFA